MEGLLAFEFVGAVTRAERGCERVAACAVHELDGLIGIGEACVVFIDLDVLLDAAEHPEFGFHADPFRMRAIDNAFGDRDILLKRLVRRVDHHAGVKAGVDAVVARLLVAVVEMHRKDRVGENFRRAADDRLQHPLVGVFARPL